MPLLNVKPELMRQTRCQRWASNWKFAAFVHFMICFGGPFALGTVLRLTGVFAAMNGLAVAGYIFIVIMTSVVLGRKWTWYATQCLDRRLHLEDLADRVARLRKLVSQ